MKEFYVGLKIKEINSKIVVKFKQSEFDQGCQLNSVNILYFDIKKHNKRGLSKNKQSDKRIQDVEKFFCY